MRPGLAILVPILAALAACGDTLVDHRDTSVRDAFGGNVCLEQQPRPQISCLVNDAPTCVDEDTAHCGSACVPCADPALPANSIDACIVPGDPGSGFCSFECTGGLLKCEGACCTVTAVAAGDAHTCAITSDGGLSCWGDNAWGQVGRTFTSVAATTPVRVFDAGVTAVAAGQNHTCAVVGGVVRCWGGAGPHAPDIVAGVTGATALAAGLSHTCAIVTGGQVRCWGATDLGQTGGGTPVSSSVAIALAAGLNHTCALLNTGAVICWGANAARELGAPTAGAFSATPVTAIASGMSALGAGERHTCAADGTRDVNPLLCWGANATGAGGAQVLPGLGDPFQAVAAGPGSGGNRMINYAVAKIDGGRRHTCVQRQGELVKCFGADAGDGQLGAAQLPNEDVDVGGVPLGATSLAVGGDHACAVFANGSVHCWGRNASGQLGDGSTTTPGIGTVVNVSGR